MEDSNINYRILIVDDSSVMRKGIMDLIKSGGISARFTEAGNGEDALESYMKIRPDLVTMDINMPGIDGIEALKQILDFDRKAKIIMLTTEADKKRIIEAVSIGAKNYIIKPMDKEKSLEKIRNALESE